MTSPAWLDEVDDWLQANNTGGGAVASDDRDALVAALGVTPLGFYDYRSGVAKSGSSVTGWAPYGAYTTLGTLSPTAGANQPVDDGSAIAFDGVDDALFCAFTSSLDLSATDLTILAVSTTSIAVANRVLYNLRNAAGNRNLIVRSDATNTNVQARFIDSTGGIDLNLGVVVGTTMRAYGQGTRRSARERQARVHNQARVSDATAGTYASEQFQITIGANNPTGGAASTSRWRALIILPTYLDLTGAAWTAFTAWAVANHSAVAA